MHASQPPVAEPAFADDGGEEFVGEIKPIRFSIKGRGASFSPHVRFDSIARVAVDDGWNATEEDEFSAGRPRTEVSIETAKSIITRNNSPDLAFSQSINPYRGCEHDMWNSR